MGYPFPQGFAGSNPARCTKNLFFYEDDFVQSSEMFIPSHDLRFLAAHRTIESAKPQPFAFFFISTSILPASAAISKSKSTIWLVALTNSRRFSLPSSVSFPSSIYFWSFLLPSETTIAGVAEYLLSTYFFAISPHSEALKYSIQA